MREHVLDAGAADPASTAPTDPAGPTGQLAQWLATVELKDIPLDVIERARYLMLDGIGCALVGAQLPWSRTAVGIVANFDGGQDCTVIGVVHEAALGTINDYRCEASPVTDQVLVRSAPEMRICISRHARKHSAPGVNRGQYLKVSTSVADFLNL